MTSTTTELEVFLGTETTDVDASIAALKLHILNEGVPSGADGSSNLRPIIWSILLNVEPMITDDYLQLIDKSASEAYQKIRNDTFRTLATDPLFKNKVTEASLIRVLNAYAWTAMNSATGNDSIGSTGTDEQEVPYVQGMNIIAAPFLYACNSEVAAFALFSTWITREIPLYVKPSLIGVHMGVKLVDQCLERLDAKLYHFLIEKNLAAEVYAFPSIMTLSVCTPPLPEVLQLWDFLIAYGPHMNILCIIAQMIMIRERIMTAVSPMSLLRKFPSLNGARIKQLAISFLPGLGDDLYRKLTRHCWDITLVDEL